MGTYINPSGYSKEVFLNRNGTEFPRQKFLDAQYEEENMWVVYIDNGPFTAAAICDSVHELKYWQGLKDESRPKRFYLVPKSALVPFLE